MIIFNPISHLKLLKWSDKTAPLHNERADKNIHPNIYLSDRQVMCIKYIAPNYIIISNNSICFPPKIHENMRQKSMKKLNKTFNVNIYCLEISNKLVAAFMNCSFFVLYCRKINHFHRSCCFFLSIYLWVGSQIIRSILFPRIS